MNGFNAYEWRVINHCQLYHNVISIADIADESGMRVASMALNPNEIPQNFNNYSIIHHKKPRGTKWSIWSNFIRTLL